MTTDNPMTRLSNFEWLKIIAMFMVVFLHGWFYVFTPSPVSTSSPASLLNYLLFQPSLIIAHNGVPLFVMTTGFFAYEKGWHLNLKRIGHIWLYALSYGIIFYFLLSPKEAGLRHSYKDILPLTGSPYWFISRYLALSLLAPFLSLLTRVLSRRQFALLLILSVLFGMTFLKGFPFGNTLGAEFGLSLGFFMCLFLFGAYVRKYDIGLHAKKTVTLLVASIILCGLFYALRDYHTSGRISIHYPEYNDPSVFTGCILFLAFKNWKPKENRLTNVFIKTVPYSLGVYLIHENVFVRPLLWDHVKTIFPQMDVNCCYSFFLSLGIDLCIFTVCIGMDFLIKLLFGICRIERCFDMILDHLALAFKRALDNRLVLNEP